MIWTKHGQCMYPKFGWSLENDIIIAQPRYKMVFDMSSKESIIRMFQCIFPCDVFAFEVPSIVLLQDTTGSLKVI